jgi:hypothetical protein
LLFHAVGGYSSLLSERIEWLLTSGYDTVPSLKTNDPLHICRSKCPQDFLRTPSMLMPVCQTVKGVQNSPFFFEFLEKEKNGLDTE